MLAWYLIRTKLGKEQKARDHLDLLLTEVLLPMLKTNVRRWGKRVRSVVPLFPCYLFARFDFELDYRRVKYGCGVRELICAGNQPLTVPEQIIETVKRRCAGGPVEIRPAPMRCGDLVHVTEGPFRGLEAVFERYVSGTERVAILLSSLEKLKPRVILRAEDLELIAHGGELRRAAV